MPNHPPESTKMHTRNQRSYTFVFERLEDKARWLAYAHRVHGGIGLKRLLLALLEADAHKHESKGPPGAE